jgi:hypothetical protein
VAVVAESGRAAPQDQPPLRFSFKNVAREGVDGLITFGVRRPRICSKRPALASRSSTTTATGSICSS